MYPGFVLHAGHAFFFGLGILQPSADPDGRRALRFETGRLRRLSARGIRVPEVLPLVTNGLHWRIVGTI